LLVGCCIGPKGALPWSVRCATILFLLYDARSASEEAFLERFARAFLAKRSTNVEFGEKLGATFFHEYIKLEGRSWGNTLSSTSLVYCASQNSNGYCLTHLKIAPRFHFLKMTFMPALRGETTR
jgi:hypothetical protein